MVRIPHIAVYQPEEGEAGVLSTLFARHECNVRWVKETEELLDLVRVENAEFDAAIVPLSVVKGASGVAVCLQIRTSDELATLPILALATSNDKAVIKSLYDAGADTVMLAPFDAELTFLQLEALRRSRAAYKELSAHRAEKEGLRSPTIQALNATREAIVLVDQNGLFVFANIAACLLFGLNPECGEKELDSIASQFHGALEQHQRGEGRSKNLADKRSTLPGSSFDLNLAKLNQQVFAARIRILDITTSAEQVCGYACLVQDQSEVTQLANLLLVGLKIRSLTLICAAANQQLLKGQAKGQLGHSFLTQLDGVLRTQATVSDFNLSLTLLLEVLDSVVDNSVQIKVQADKNYKVSLSPGDLLQVLGYTLFYAADAVAAGGEVALKAAAQDSKFLEVVLRTESKRASESLSNDVISSLLRGEFNIDETGANEHNDIIFALRLAKQITREYGGELSLQQPTFATSELTLKLPLA